MDVKKEIYIYIFYEKLRKSLECFSPCERVVLLGDLSVA